MNQMNKEIKRYNPNAVYDDLSKSLHDKFSNPSWNGPFLGTVVSAPPELQVQIDEKIILTKDKIIVAWEKVKDYNREFREEGNIEINISELNVNANTKDSGGDTHNNIIASGTVKGTYKADGMNWWTDELKVGDLVILNEFKNQKKFYLVDVAFQYKQIAKIIKYDIIR